ncbi:MAG: transposase [FCB group bacterium]|nr:transposase [FCB group bacterium]
MNTTDPDSRTQLNIGPGYNVQIAVDTDSYLISANKVVQDANDTQLLLTMIEETEISTGSEGKSKKIFADSGYASANNFEQVEDKEHLDVYVPARELVNRSKNPLLSAYID